MLGNPAQPGKLASVQGFPSYDHAYKSRQTYRDYYLTYIQLTPLYLHICFCLNHVCYRIHTFFSIMLCLCFFVFHILNLNLADFWRKLTGCCWGQGGKATHSPILLNSKQRTLRTLTLIQPRQVPGRSGTKPTPAVQHPPPSFWGRRIFDSSPVYVRS